MDLAVRASLKGWKFVYLGDLKVHVTYAYLLLYLFVCLRLDPIFVKSKKQ